MPLFVSFQKIGQAFLPRLIIASFFSLGKIFSSAGSTLFSVQQMMQTYGANKSLITTFSILLTANNVLLTSGTRAPPIYRKLLNIHGNPRQHQHNNYQNLAHQEPASIILSTPINILYYLLLTLGYLSSPFSALSAYLSGTTLIESIYDVDPSSSIAFASFVTTSSMLSYFNFNLRRMRKNVLRCCIALDNCCHGGSLDLQNKTVLWTGLSSIFGVAAGIGTSFLGTTQSLELFPLTHDLSSDTKEMIVLISVIASLFSSMFIFGVSCYDQIKEWLERPSQASTKPAVPYYAQIMVLINSISNSLAGFVGIINLLNHFAQSDQEDWRLILAGVMPLLNNIFMNFCLDSAGSRTTTLWLQHQSHKVYQRCCPNRLPLLSIDRHQQAAYPSPLIIMTAPRLVNFASSSRYSPTFFRPSLPNTREEQPFELEQRLTPNYCEGIKFSASSFS